MINTKAFKQTQLIIICFETNLKPPKDAHSKKGKFNPFDNINKSEFFNVFSNILP